ncbi:4-hydroxy-tetrahydrodipicolinate reductase [Viridibacillus sp. YIM B01967]|uniref:4-hydroxy-tetrahydrodipicolinate reductase n=1 Tax=Viridibacillus soli TaxID=2798301 RepID=A0ABS1HBA7_9BACL|nr:4-hydroxy-tetrahydrodipicolinate reductase [Viridibacillus soli]MBK3496741.1 4-hydroxy-tetrahydrodipicolinate reductase [Viridibacillus soli]
MTIRVAIAGPRGKMGSEAVHTVMKNDNMELVAVLDHREIADSLEDYAEFPNNYCIPVYTDLESLFKTERPDVFVDLTTPETVYKHTKEALLNGVRPVIGTTGFTDEQLEELTELSTELKLGTIIAPNFAIGAILMMKFSQMAAAYLPDVEIIEMHHDRKLDAPSGTANKTAQLIQENRRGHKQGHPDEVETIEGARGADIDGMRIHSVRLPGLVAHQQVLFGGEGQLLTLRHDSFSRSSFMSGVKFSIEKVMELDDLVYGLENIL